jgi:uncharacterized protein YciI
MFLVELAFGSDPERLAARPAHRDTLLHLHRIGAVRMAGPFHDDTGALLVFDVADGASLERLIDADPYYRTPGVTVVRKQEWNPLFT